jgi:cytochrome c peroxidase
MLFPKFHIDEVKKQEGRDLTRFDLDFDLPDHILPEFPPPIYLTTRPDLGDVSRGKLVTMDNFYEIFQEILNPKQLGSAARDPVPTGAVQRDERPPGERPSRGVTCFDCHVNGHTNGANHLVGDIRPQESRHRIETHLSASTFSASSAAARLKSVGTSPVRAARRPTSTATHRRDEGRKSSGAGAKPLHGGVQALLDFRRPRS